MRYRIWATKKTRVGPRDSRHEEIHAEGVEIVSVTVRARDGELRQFDSEHWDIEIRAEDSGCPTCGSRSPENRKLGGSCSDSWHREVSDAEAATAG